MTHFNLLYAEEGSFFDCVSPYMFHFIWYDEHNLFWNNNIYRLL